MRKFVQIFTTIVLILILCSCDKKENNLAKENATKDFQKIRSDFHENFLKNLRSKTNRVEICSYRLRNGILEDTTSILETKNLASSGKLKSFNILFDTLKNNGYCCCPKTHYTMRLFNENKMLKRYNIDTIQLKGKVIIFDTSFQTSYIFPLKDWNNLIGI